MVQHNFGLMKSFSSSAYAPDEDSFMFLPNPKFKGMISPFHSNMLRNYIADYNLELTRRAKFKDYPSRLQAIFLLDSEEAAYQYSENNPEHVKNRTLVKGVTDGVYLYSLHDSVWIDFLRLPHGTDQQTINSVTEGYWSGEIAENCSLESCGKKWTKKPAFEVLFVGRLNFESLP